MRKIFDKDVRSQVIGGIILWILGAVVTFLRRSVWPRVSVTAPKWLSIVGNYSAIIFIAIAFSLGFILCVLVIWKIRKRRRIVALSEKYSKNEAFRKVFIDSTDANLFLRRNGHKNPYINLLNELRRDRLLSTKVKESDNTVELNRSGERIREHLVGTHR